jgi:peptidoglycan/xylan/chitin deacetylase (PgdA/CDA1 family)
MSRRQAFFFPISLTLLCWMLLTAGCASAPEGADLSGSADASAAVRREPLRLYPSRWYGARRAACSVTFDDGTVDQYLLAAPELEKRGMRGTFFVITGFMEKGIWYDGSVPRPLFGWDEARELAFRGHEIASHTETHRDLAAHPDEAEDELKRSLADLRRELPWVPVFSLGWPYWRSSEEAIRASDGLYYAARAGGISASSGDPHLGGVNGASPAEIMRIGARGILSGDGEEELMPVVDEVYTNGGWLIPNFHGFRDDTVAGGSAGWEPLSMESFRVMLDTLAELDIWFAPFGEVASYVRQRDALRLKAAIAKNGWRIDYASPLDSRIYSHPLTLILELPEDERVHRARLKDGARDLPFFRLTGDQYGGQNAYLIEVPAGSGSVLIERISSMRPEKA